EALEKAEGNQAAAAEILKISPTALRGRIKTIRKFANKISTKKSNAVLIRLNKALKGRRAGKRERLLMLPKFTEETIQALEETEGSKVMAVERLKIILSGLDYRIKRIKEMALKLKTKESKAVLKRLNKALKGKMAGKRPLRMPRHTKETIEALEKAEGNKSEAAIILNISYMGIVEGIKTIQNRARELNTNESNATLGRLNEALKGQKAGKTVPIMPRKRKVTGRLPSGLPKYTKPTIEALEKSEGNQTAGAESLGISIPGLRYRIRRIEKAAEKFKNKETKTALAKLKKALKGKMAGKRPLKY
ncbi:unnamed protein product, partial [marine sediment metagenome]